MEWQTVQYKKRNMVGPQIYGSDRNGRFTNYAWSKTNKIGDYSTRRKLWSVSKNNALVDILG